MNYAIQTMLTCPGVWRVSNDPFTFARVEVLPDKTVHQLTPELQRDGELSPGKWHIATRCEFDAEASAALLANAAVPVVDMTTLQAVYAAGFRRAAVWAGRDDLPADVGSPAYLKDMAGDLAEFADFAITPAQPVAVQEARESAEFDDYPEFHAMAMGCGLEDRGIHDRYDAMRYGWDEALQCVAERINGFLEHLSTAPAAPTEPAGFKSWAQREGLDVTRAESMCLESEIPHTDKGMGPSTYWRHETETAWRAWANKPTKQAAPKAEQDMRAVCEALGFDPTNHHNAAKCPYCQPEQAASGVESPSIDTLQPWTLEHLTTYPNAALEILNKRINSAPRAWLTEHDSGDMVWTDRAEAEAYSDDGGPINLYTHLPPEQANGTPGADELRRWTVHKGGMVESQIGEWVRFDDLAARTAPMADYPPLPRPEHVVTHVDSQGFEYWHLRFYSEEQMRAYINADRDAQGKDGGA